MLAALPLLFAGCSQHSNSIPSKAWHNTTSHYNAYFLAKEKILKVENGIYQGHTENYNRILDVYPLLAESEEQKIAADLLEAIKKASLVISRHKNSQWVDNSYLEIGKARYYKKEDYDNAIHTFKYINSKSKDPHMRHQALLWLMRTYTKGEDYNNGFIVLDYLRKQKMIKPNLIDYHLNRAWFHQRQGQIDETAEHLEVATNMMFWHNDRRARYHYVIGQIRQKQKRDSAAYKHYAMVIKNNPPYEMAFHARLSLAQVTPATDAKKVAKVQRRFKKMLKDEKNEEYKDRVYYEMGRFAYKLGDIKLAEQHYKSSVAVESKNVGQKAYGYLRLGEINYDHYKNYVQASKYYDSCITSLDTLHENYAAILSRQQGLKEFAKQYEIVAHEDSLQRLANMDSVQLLAIIDKMIDKEEEAAALEEKAAKKAEREARAAQYAQEMAAGNFNGRDGLGFDPGAAAAAGGSGNGKWYFYNPAQIGSGKQAFERKFGKRPLEDHWRRRSKERDFDAIAAKEAANGQEGAVANATAAAGGEKGADSTGAEGTKAAEGAALADAEGKKADPMASRMQRRQELKKDIPFTEDQMAASHEKIKPALYIMGKIYEQKLNERELATATFNRIIDNYYTYEKVPEVLYFLYFMHGESNKMDQQAKVKDMLLTDYLDTKYAQLILDPDYLLKKKARNEVVSNLYAQAYDNYNANRFVEAQQLLEQIDTDFGDNSYKDKVRVLGIMILGKTNDIGVYKDSLTTFISTNAKSTMLPFAQELLQNANTFQALAAKAKKDSLNPAGTDSTAVPKGPAKTDYKTFVATTQICVIALPVNNVDIATFTRKLSDFNKKYYPDETYTVDNAMLGDKYTILIRVRDFRTQLQGLNYIKKLKTANSPVKELVEVQPRVFLITYENFPLLFRSKNINEYLEFFKKYYDDKVLEGF